MSSRILVADDSVTVQKVIEMTLSSEDCILESCLSEDLLLKKLHSDSYDLVVMDFNLSTQKSGVDIAREIYQLFPEVPVMVMLGTFDSVDENSWGQTGIRDKIVKPFNGREFVEKCLNLLRKEKRMDAHDHWSIDGAGGGGDFQDEDTVEQDRGMKSLLDADKLQREVKDWGIGFPEIIGTEKINTSMDSLPDIIENASDAPVENVSIKREELEFEGQRDNIDVDKFWSVDSDVPGVETSVDSQSVDERKNHLHLDEGEMIDKIQDALRPALEGIVKQYCSQKVEEIAWEVIPDLAENLIRNEIKQISSRLSGK